jgi:hypothetical protein
MRWLAGILLVAAAIFKAVDVAHQPSATNFAAWAGWSVPLQIGVELALGMLALSGLYWRILRWPMLLLFVGFAARSFSLALRGSATCECFGSISIHPWWTFLLDLLVLGSLVIPMMGGATFRNYHDANAYFIKRFNPSPTMRGIIISAVTMCSIGVAVLLARSGDGRRALAFGMRESADDVAILQPEKWIGHKLPIAEAVDIDVSHGNWLVLLHRDDCPVCRQILPRYEHLATTGRQVALIEVPPYGRADSHIPDCHYGHLSDNRKWFVETPFEIQLEDGLVTSAKRHGD